MQREKQIHKMEFIEQLAARLGITVTEAERMLNNTLELIYYYVSEGIKVNIGGFGKFERSHRNARLGVNPRTLQKIRIPELYTPKFRAGDAFKSAIRK